MNFKLPRRFVRFHVSRQLGKILIYIKYYYGRPHLHPKSYNHPASAKCVCVCVCVLKSEINFKMCTQMNMFFCYCVF